MKYFVLLIFGILMCCLMYWYAMNFYTLEYRCYPCWKEEQEKIEALKVQEKYDNTYNAGGTYPYLDY